jgi:hypothetical protein
MPFVINDFKEAQQAAIAEVYETLVESMMAIQSIAAK